MKWVSSVAQGQDGRAVLAQCAEAVRRELNDAAPDLALAFASPHFRRQADAMPEWVGEFLAPRVFAGTSAMGLIGAGREWEQATGISMVAARLPEVDLRLHYTDASDLPDEDAPPDAWRDWLGLGPEAEPHFVVLADPFSSALEPFLSGLDYAFPAASKIGGLASGGGQPGENFFFVGDEVRHEGLVSLIFSGNVVVDTIVAQGCRPIGEPLTVTCANGNLLLEVNGEPPLKYLQQLVPRLHPDDQQLVSTSLFLGIEMDPLNARPGPGDFMIRNLVGVDYSTGVMAVGAELGDGQIVQFHLRDRRTSAEDLGLRLDAYRASESSRHARGALLFACLGRGEYLYREPNFDTRQFGERFASVPMGGFFANGEIGPVGGATFIHGYTSSFGLFRPRDP